MIIIGIDPHKSTHVASAVDAATNTTVASLQIEASLPGYRQLHRWAGQFVERRWAVNLPQFREGMHYEERHAERVQTQVRSGVP